MTVLTWALVGAVSAVSAETWMRLHPTTFPWMAYVASLVTTYCVWQILRQDTILHGMILWTTSIAAGRLIATWYLNEPISGGTWVGFLLMLVANFIKRF